MPVTLVDIDRGLRVGVRDYLESYAAVAPPRTVAVVGNAPMGPDPARASRIDRADLVIRLNSYAIDGPGEPRCHGTRADVVVFSRGVRVTPHFFDDYAVRGFLMTEVAQTWWRTPRPVQEHFPPDLGYWCVPNRAVIDPLRALIWPDAGSERVDPTTGTVAVWLAYSLFPEASIVITGFSYLDEQERTSWEHHASGRVVNVPTAHRVGREGALINSWVAEGRITVLD